MTFSIANEILGTATVSFLLGWTFKKYRLHQVLKNFRVLASENSKLVIVVRSDLPMTKGKVAAQCSHAAVSCYKQGMTVCPDIVKQWEIKGQPKIILRTDKGERGLKELSKKAADVGLVAVLIRDAGRTEVAAGSPTVLGIGPGCVKKIDEVTSSLKLL